jgi:hypothetical protein
MSKFRGPLRDWGRDMPSYSATDGRAITSIGDERGRGGPSGSNDHATNVSAQVPDAFKHVDARRTQDATPVRKRPLG